MNPRHLLLATRRPHALRPPAFLGEHQTRMGRRVWWRWAVTWVRWPRPFENRVKIAAGEGRAVGVCCDESEAGEASIEFLGVVMILVVPVFYLIATLGVVQSAVFASEAAARNAARIVADNMDRTDVAVIQGRLTFDDYGVGVTPHMSFTCVAGNCQPGVGSVQVSVDAQVPLPLLPEWMGVGAAIPIHADVAMPISGVRIE